MRLFRLEIKRILKSRRTLIILAIALLLSVAMAYLPISFEGINRPNEDGTVMQNNFLSQLADFNYLNIGGMSFWTPHVILISAGIELFLFTFLAIHSYCRHQVA